MTLAELHERIGWQLEGRLQIRNQHGDFFDWSHPNRTPVIFDPPDLFRRRPDAPPMPDEVWVGQNLIAACGKIENGQVRYVRAGAIIPAEQIEVRQSKGAWVYPHHSNEYRIKP